MNLDVSIIHTEPMMSDACTYCDRPIRGKHIQLTFENKNRKLRFHIEEELGCWTQFVHGVEVIDEKLMIGAMN